MASPHGWPEWCASRRANPASARQVDPDNAEHVALGRQVYVSFCAGCHGVNLEGQPNWRQRLPLANLPAPPHDASGHTWHHADPWLFKIVKFGSVSFPVSCAEATGFWVIETTGCGFEWGIS